MPHKDELRRALQASLTGVIADYLGTEVGQALGSLRLDAPVLDLAAEAQLISQTMTENIFTTLDVYARQLLYPNQETRTTDWLRTQNYMHRREDEDNRPQDL